MSIVKSLVGLILALLIAGCATPTIHKTAREFKADGSTHSVDTFTVNRPYRAVAQTYAKMTPRCLNITVKHSTTNAKYGSNVTYRYTSSVKRSSNKTQLTVQKFTVGMHEAYVRTGEVPRDGIYVLMVEATPASNNTTKITMYSRNWVYPPTAFINAIKGWSSGKYIGCPSFE